MKLTIYATLDLELSEDEARKLSQDGVGGLPVVEKLIEMTQGVGVDLTIQNVETD